MEDKYIERLKTMETGVITDTLKFFGYDGWMLDMHPVNPDFKICGRAFTMQFSMEPNIKGVPHYTFYDVVEKIHPGDVIVLAAGNCPYAVMGENMQHASKMMGAAGIILDGKNRDTAVIRKYDQPVFSRGQEVRFMPGNFQITEYDIPVNCAGAKVRPGDYIIGDADGVIVIPEFIIEEVLYQAEYVAEIEEQMDRALESGASMQECLKVISQKRNKRS